MSPDTYRQRAVSPLCERQMLMTNEEAIVRLHNRAGRRECSLAIQVDEMDIATAWKCSTASFLQPTQSNQVSAVFEYFSQMPTVYESVEGQWMRSNRTAYLLFRIYSRFSHHQICNSCSRTIRWRRCGWKRTTPKTTWKDQRRSQKK